MADELTPQLANVALNAAITSELIGISAGFQRTCGVLSSPMPQASETSDLPKLGPVYMSQWVIDWLTKSNKDGDSNDVGR
jgi:hypothetical protein